MSFVEKGQKGLTRRDFIKGTAAGAVGGVVAGAAGTVLAASKAEPTPAQPAMRMPSEAMCAEIVKMRGHEGDTIDAYLAACTLKGIDAAVACYPGGVGAGKEGLTPRQPVDPLDYTKELSCPLLGLFGREDKRPSPEHVAKTEAELKKWGKTYEFHTYDNAGHSFFMVDRADYRPVAAVDGWKKVFQWFGKYLR